MAIFAKQISRILNFYQTTKHKIDVTETSVENANKKILLWQCKITNGGVTLWCVTLIPARFYAFKSTIETLEDSLKSAKI